MEHVISIAADSKSAFANPHALKESSSSVSLWDLSGSPTETASTDVTQSPMLKRYPSFVPLRNRATSIAEVAFLVPSSESTCRKATVMAATFNMTATIVGGGVLSIPLACARAGIIPFTFLMIISAAATDFSLYLLVSCSRRCGSTSFSSVAKSSYGPGVELCTTVVIVFLVVLVVIGLMILNEGIWSPIIMAGINSFGGDDDETEVEAEHETIFEDAVVLLVLLITMSPFLLKKDLTSLRHICFVGFFSVAVLCAAMVYRAVELNFGTSGIFQAEVKWMATSVFDMIHALPIILLTFLCSFNMISVSCSLVNPTRDRVREVISKAVFLSFLLMYIFGLAGYLYAYDGSDGNILLNFDPKDPIIFFGRIGCGITTLFALPMNILPCREALLSLIAQISELNARRRVSKEEQRQLLEKRRSSEVATEHGVQTHSSSRYGTNTNQSASSKHTAADDAFTRKEEAIHVISTVVIVLVCYIAAVLSPGVAVVWDIAGSSMAFLIQFIVPTACYIKLKFWSGQKHLSKNLVLAWALLVFAVVMTVVCTTQTLLQLSNRF